MEKVQPQVHRIENHHLKLSPKEDARLRKACKEFESILLSYVFKDMRETVQKSGLLDESGANPESTFISMLDNELAKEMCLRNNLGLAEALYRQLTEVKELKEPAGYK